MPPRDGRDLARVLLDRADDDITLGYLIGLVEATGIEAPAAVLNAGELSPWAVDFRYETDDEPALDRHATLVLINEIRAWARVAVDG